MYSLKVFYLLTKKIEAGSRDVVDDWSMVVDVTDNLDSDVAQYACKDVEIMENGFGKYIRSTYMVDIIQQRKSCNIDEALRYLKEDNDKSGEFYESALNNIKNSLPLNEDKEFDQNDFNEM